MVNFNVFDSILDLVFIVDADGVIVYCNDMAATFSASSVRRLVGKVKLSEVWEFGTAGLLPWTQGSIGRVEASAFIETAFRISKTQKSGKVQLAVRPMGDQTHWGFFIKDVSLEETLALKYRAELAKTEEYARNLEKLVAERTQELNSVNQTLKAILNSLGQGFFTFNSAGDCGPVFTRACETILEKSPIHLKAWSVLGLVDQEVAQFQKWMDSLFKEYLPFDDLKTLGPNLYAHSQSKHVVLDFFPIRNDKNQVEEIVVVATDKTTEHRAQLDLELERQFVAMIVKYSKNKDLFLQFLSSVQTSFDMLLSLCGQSMNQDGLRESYRLLHTLEGEAGTFSLAQLRQSSRVCQQKLEPFKNNVQITVDQLRAYQTELHVMAKDFTSFLNANRENFKIPEGGVTRQIEVPFESVEQFSKELARVSGASHLKQSFQNLFLRTPIDSRLKYFDGLVRSVAQRLEKQVHPLKIEGGELLIFPEPYKKFFSNLVHAFRNAVDHGLETPDERVWAGKDPAGRITVLVTPLSKSGSGFKLVITDDGKGIDPIAIREKLAKKFPERDFSTENDEAILQKVCLPGFSSRDQIGEFSGRGVGLDSLREEVIQLGGQIHLRSKLGEGTSIEIELPELGCDLVNLRSA